MEGTGVAEARGRVPVPAAGGIALARGGADVTGAATTGNAESVKRSASGAETDSGSAEGGPELDSAGSILRCVDSVRDESVGSLT
jgi:hypothetical protein